MIFPPPGEEHEGGIRLAERRDFPGHEEREGYTKSTKAAGAGSDKEFPVNTGEIQEILN